MATVYRRTAKGKFYGVYTDAHGHRVRKSTGTTNKQDAQRIAQKWEADANAVHQGIASAIDASLTELLDEYIRYIGNSGDVHQEKTEARIKRIIDTNDWSKPDQVSQLGLETAVREFKNLRNGAKMALRTQAHYITSMKAFTAWLTDVRKVYLRNPLVAVRKPSFAHDRKLIRRFLLPDEWRWLSQTDNAVLYQLAIETGFRAGEIRKIARKHIAADHILLPANLTKNKLAARQYITPDLHAKLSMVELPFAFRDANRMASLLHSDLAIARQKYIDSVDKGATPNEYLLLPANALGHMLDFHSLRHTCGAWLAIAGVNAKTIQSVMRHSTITLTLDTYGHLMPGAEADAITQLGRIMHDALGTGFVSQSSQIQPHP